MIGKIAPKGRGFRGLCAYALRQGRGQIVAGPMAGRTPRELSREFGALRRLNPKLTKAVAHLMLSPAPGDPPLTDSQWQAIADRYIEGMGYAQAPWVGIVHRDTDHQHLHIIACRIGFDGKTVSDANDFRKSEAVVRRLESEFELVSVASPKGIKRKSTPQQANTTTEGAPVMTDTNAMPPNPFHPSDPQHATWPHAYEPGRDLAAYFSDRGRPFQADRGRQISAVGDAPGRRASSGLNVSQSSTISLKRAVVGPCSGLGLMG